MSSDIQPPLRRTSPESRAATNALVENLVSEFGIHWLAKYEMGERFLSLAKLRGYVSARDIDLVDPAVVAALKELEGESGVAVHSMLMERCMPKDEKRERNARKMGFFLVCLFLFVMVVVAPLFEADLVKLGWSAYIRTIPGVFF
ncbi:hypothetical protein CC79DRAFT_1370310 [Sarocladium strictum]